MSIRSLFNGDTQYFVINKNTRVITPPTDFKNFGVESDENSNRVYFQCPRYVGDNLDLTTLSVRVNYQNANNDKDQYIVTDVTPDGENVYFSWVLSRKATAYKGSVYFIVCAVKTDSNGVITNEWNTTLTSGTVLSGLEVESPVITEDVTDVVNQLLAIVNGAVTDMESAASEGVANIKAAETQAIAAVSSAPHSLFANAIKGNVSGSIARADDVSPVEHTVSVTAQGKNLFNGELEKGHYFETELTLTNTSSTVYRSFQMYLRKGTYTLSASVKIMVLRMYVDGAMQLPAIYGTTHTFTARTDGIVAFSLREATSADWDDSTTVQLEKGGTATGFAPYIAPATVTVNRCGKNLLKNIAKNHTTTGLDFTVYEDSMVKVNGTATATTYMEVGTVNLKAGKTYTLSGCPAGGNALTYRLDLRLADRSLYEPFVYDYGEGAVFTPVNDVTLSVGLRYFIDAVIENKIFSPMVELTDCVTEYEPYNGATYTPDTAGNVNAVSLAPTMTLFTDTEGVNIDCEYNKDTNAVIQSLIERLVELESN